MALELNVTRHPYSFIGDSRESQGPGGLQGAGAPVTETWHDALLGYMGGDPVRRMQAEEGMRQQGRAAGISFDYNVKAQWQPVDSQRLLLWAGRFGKQEEFMSALNKRHFEQRQSASDKGTLLAAAAEVGLDVAAADAFLQTDELVDTIWRSYGRTIRELRIHSIPLFALSVPSIGAIGGPFRAPRCGRATPWRGAALSLSRSFALAFSRTHALPRTRSRAQLPMYTPHGVCRSLAPCAQPRASQPRRGVRGAWLDGRRILSRTLRAHPEGCHRRQAHL